VVDDNATNRRLLEEMLTNWGIEPRLAAGAAEALAALQASVREGKRFELVLTDINMPEADGFSLVEAIRGDAVMRSTKVIVLTSGDRPGDINRARVLGVSGYLVKPVKQSELFDAIVAALGVTSVDHEPDRRAATEAAPAIRPLRILLAEDSIPNQKLATGLLMKWGHTVTVAGNGREAVALWKSRSFDLILMDVQMPELDGMQATSLIREQERDAGRGAHLPIIAMTAHAMKGDREQCLAAGMDSYVPKPIRVKELQAALSEFFGSPPEAAIGRSEPAGRSDLVDWQAALETVQGDRGLLKAVIDAVLAECPTLIVQLERDVAAGDAPGVRRAAHTIKGSLRTFESAQAAEFAEQIESAGRSGNLSGVPALVPGLKKVLDAVLQELSRFSVDES
ncbi:MAG: response regulator, partial [Planctomycetia bacterium]|nr:response regulator [Planctomycetia bacterium]